MSPADKMAFFELNYFFNGAVLSAVLQPATWGVTLRRRRITNISSSEISQGSKSLYYRKEKSCRLSTDRKSIFW